MMATLTVAGRLARETFGRRLLRIFYSKIRQRSNVFLDARELVGLLPAERILARGWADAKPVMVTDRAFYWGLRSASTRIGWEQIARSHWDQEAGTLTILGLLPGVPTKLTFELGSPELATLVADRVTASHLISTRVDLDGHGQARVVARRKPGTDDLVWLVALADGTSPHAPGVSAAVDRALADLCRELKPS